MIRLHPKWLALGVLALLAVAAGGTWLLLRGSNSSNTARASTPATARSSAEESWPTSAAMRNAARTLELEVGTELTYTADFGAEFMQGDAPAPNVAPEAGRESTGGAATLTLRVAERTAEKLVMEGQVTDLSMAFDEKQQNAEATLAAMQRDLAPPFRVSLASSGRIEDLSVANEVSAYGLATIRSFLAALQFIEPPGAKLPSTWTTEEPDQYGIARVRYSSESPGKYEKSRFEYVRLAFTRSFGSVPGRQPVVRSHTTVLRNAERIVQQATTEDEVKLPFGETWLVGKSHQSLRLTAARRAAPALGLSALRQVGMFGAEPLDPSVARAKPRIRATLAELLGEMESLKKEGSKKAKLDLMYRLATWLEQQPNGVREALRELRNDPSRETTRLLLGALSTADTPEALAGLTELATDKSVNEELRSDAIDRVGMHSRPTAASIDALRDATRNPDEEFRNVAKLSLGTAIGKASNSDDSGARASAERAAQELGAAVERATSESERATNLDAVGNAAQPGTLAQIEAALQSPDTGVRASAVFALRNVPGPRADQLIARTISEDAAETVRRSGLEAARYRQVDEPLLVAAIQALEQEANAALRGLAIANVIARAGPAATALAALERAVKDDPSEAVRRMAGNALAAAG